MGFLFGLMVGGMLASGGTVAPHLQAMLLQIPLRCFAALEISDAEYRLCRRPSLRHELDIDARRNDWSYCANYLESGRYPKEDCDVNAHLDWEVKALHALEAAAKKAADSSKP